MSEVQEPANANQECCGRNHGDAGCDAAPDASPRPVAAKKKQENPLVNILVNVLIPVVALSALSKEQGKPWHIGPLNGMIIAVAFPVLYGTWDLISKRKVNFFSILGIVGVLLTGGITLYVWNDDNTVKGNAAILFAVKEATIPTIFGILILGSHWTAKPLVRVFLYNPDIFDIGRIEKAVDRMGKVDNYRQSLFRTTCIMSVSFFISACMNYGLAMYFLKGIEPSKVAYNEAIAKLTGWGYLVIGVPCLLIWLIAWWLLVRSLRNFTGLQFDDMTVFR